MPPHLGFTFLIKIDLCCTLGQSFSYILLIYIIYLKCIQPLWNILFLTRLAGGVITCKRELFAEISLGIVKLVTLSNLQMAFKAMVYL